jgi:squalene synthase HpnC
LRKVLAERSISPVHAQHLLRAFRQDVTKLRYSDWDDLIDYCRYSAMPVGRYVLDVHGETKATWPANDALCAALQIINHLQDCAKDYRSLDRVYLPEDTLAAQGTGVEALAAPKASPALLRCIRDLARRTGTLLDESRPFASLIADRRLAMEVAAIQRLAERLVALLLVHDPLSERVHLSKPQMLLTGAAGVAQGLVRRVFARKTPRSAFGW